jgi:hypothetical protein
MRGVERAVEITDDGIMRREAQSTNNECFARKSLPMIGILSAHRNVQVVCNEPIVTEAVYHPRTRSGCPLADNNVGSCLFLHKREGTQKLKGNRLKSEPESMRNFDSMPSTIVGREKTAALSNGCGRILEAVLRWRFPDCRDDNCRETHTCRLFDQIVDDTSKCRQMNMVDATLVCVDDEDAVLCMTGVAGYRAQSTRGKGDALE